MYFWNHSGEEQFTIWSYLPSRIIEAFPHKFGKKRSCRITRIHTLYPPRRNQGSNGEDIGKWAKCGSQKRHSRGRKPPISAKVYKYVRERRPSKIYTASSSTISRIWTFHSWNFLAFGSSWPGPMLLLAWKTASFKDSLKGSPDCLRSKNSFTKLWGMI